MAELLLATGNAGKVREIRELTAQTPLRWLGLHDFPHVPEPDETGATFAQNARLKALYYAAATGRVTLADDSGLEVECLNGTPGVHSARYAGEPRDDRANNRKLIEALSGIAPEQRTARFQCVMAFAVGTNVVAEASGFVEGRIVDEPRGENGFGYDPHFFLPELRKTMAELPPAEKNALSHRGQALRAMLPQIEKYLRDNGLWKP